MVDDWSPNYELYYIIIAFFKSIKREASHESSGILMFMFALVIYESSKNVLFVGSDSISEL